MGKHSAPENKKIRKAFKKVATTAALTVGSAAVAGSALFAAQGTAAATPDQINVFGQDLTCTTSVDQQTDWNTIAERQEAALQEDYYRELYDNFLAQFDQFRGQPLEQMAKNVNALVYNSIDHFDKGPYGFGFNAPVETVASGNGDSQDVAALQEDIMRYLGVSPDQMLVARTLNQGDPTKSLVVLLVSPTPSGKPTAETIVMTNFSTIAHLSSVNDTWIVTHGEMTNLVPVDARSSVGKVCKPRGMS